MEAAEPHILTARPSYGFKLLSPGKRHNVPALKISTTPPQGTLPKNAKLKKRSPPAEVTDTRKVSGGKTRCPSPKPLGRMTKTTTTTTRKGSTAGQQPPLPPLSMVPWTKRKFGEERKVSISKRDRNTEKRDVAPHSASTDREGRQFAVANMGNNGKIYLRPSIRHVNKQDSESSFTFPITPPGTAGVEIIHHDQFPTLPSKIAEHHGAQNTPKTETLAAEGAPTPIPELDRPARKMKHRRAMSDGRVPEVIRGQSASDASRPVPNPRPSDSERPKTTNDQSSKDVPTLNIQIPSWRLGTPRFTARGTPVLRGPSVMPTEDGRSSKLSLWNPMRGNLISGTLPNIGSSRLSHLAVPQSACGLSRASQTHPLRLLRPSRSTYLAAIEPAMFTSLTFKPSCDDRTIVRYSSTGTVTAATAPRLVAEITSPSFLDYELISDFFLTYRAFLEPEILLQMLVARLRWALERMDETGMIVRVRTFVAVRHWILNYFLDDFVLDYGLRVTFCILLNNFADELAQDARVRKVQLKILGELKKCWRRICTHYWDGPDFDNALGVDGPIVPGGIFGNRDPSLEPTNGGREDNITQPDGGLCLDTSDASPLNAELTVTTPLGSHPVMSFPPHNVASGSAATSTPTFGSVDMPSKPKTPISKRVRTGRTHLRNNSNTDTMIERKSEAISHNVEAEPILQSAGSLVRGNILPPGQPYVEVDDNPSESNRQTTIVRSQIRSPSTERIPAGSTTPGNGVKKLIGSVRRALNSRGPRFSPLQTNYTGLSPVSPPNDPGTVINPAPGTDVDPQSQNRRNGARQPMRIDLLGAEVAENFKSAVRQEEAAAEAERLGIPIPPNTTPVATGPQDYSAAYMESSLFDNSSNQKQTPACNIEETNNDLAESQLQGLPREIVSLNSSNKSLADSFLLIGGGPTPPTTPPAQGTIGLPSYLVDPPPEELPNPTPPFVPDLIIPGEADSLRSSEDSSQASSSMASSPRPRHPPPISGGLLRMQKRKGTPDIPQPVPSKVPRQPSFASRFIRRSVKPNTDPTTNTSTLDEFLDDCGSPPRYIIRRRPGGDLRAVTSAKEFASPVLRASRSVGSLTTSSGSFRSSILLRLSPDSDPYVEAPADKDSSTEPNSLRSVPPFAKSAKVDKSLINTHRSKPGMLPCFEEEARKLAALSDDEEDDGGIEAALLKLEGKYKPKRKKPVESTEEAHEKEEPSAETKLAAIFSNSQPQIDKEAQNLQPHERALWLLEGGGRKTPVSANSSVHLDAASQPVHDAQSFISEVSQESYNSIPLLDRDLTDDYHNRQAKTKSWTDRSMYQVSDDDASEQEKRKKSSDGVVEADLVSLSPVENTRSLGSFEAERQSPLVRVQHRSFLDDGSVAGSDISSDLSIKGEKAETADGDAELVKATTSTTTWQKTPTPPPHPFGKPMTVSSTDSPAISISLTQALDMGPERRERELFPEQIWATKSLPTAPEIPPATSCIDKLASSLYESSPASGLSPDCGQKQAEAFRKFSVHLPFILAFESITLAQQFTLIEQDALSDIDWKDLIEMSWKDSTTSDSRSWVDFLRNTEAYGVEVVIARFNLMVKWAISEIVLTQHTEERARCIVKFIHIAAHCRSYRNFATLAQLTIALTSNEISRLTKTWELVPDYDMKTLDELETLVTPTRNFYNLRAEMEIGTDGGCIPFVGIYTHDLLYNAQRPSEIASSPSTAPLINFERHRIGAAVVKTLLRLLEASTRYAFQPIEGITERCLWMSALSDDEIRRHSESLE